MLTPQRLNINTGGTNGVDQSIQTPYIQNGLTYVSNNTSIHPRDEAGNIILQENSETNPILVIEPTKINYLTRSVIRHIDTNFEYFKFPVTTLVTDADTPIDLDINVDVNIDNDPIYAYYKPTTDTAVAGGGSEYSGIDMGKVMEGQPQTYTNGYYITKDIKSSGKDLRFRIKLTHQFNGNESGDQQSSIYFSIIKSGPNTQLDRNWKTGYASSRQITTNFTQLIRDIAVPMEEICSAASGVRDGKADKRQPWWNYWKLFVPNAIPNNQTRLTGNQLEAIDFVFTRNGGSDVPDLSKDDFNAKRNRVTAAVTAYNTAVDLSNDTWGFINIYTQQSVYIDEIILNSQFETGDVFSIGQLSGQAGNSIIAIQSYWSITDASKQVNEWNQEIV